jgi:hypothetical protein
MFDAASGANKNIALQNANMFYRGNKIEKVYFWTGYIRL